MKTNENPVPPASGSRADIKVERASNNASASNWEARAVSFEVTQDLSNVSASLLRDFVFETLAPVEADAAAARLSLRNDDDAGARYHLQRAIACVKAAATTFRELEAPKGGNHRNPREGGMSAPQNGLGGAAAEYRAERDRNERARRSQPGNGAAKSRQEGPNDRVPF